MVLRLPHNGEVASSRPNSERRKNPVLLFFFLLFFSSSFFENIASTENHFLCKIFTKIEILQNQVEDCCLKYLDNINYYVKSKIRGGLDPQKKLSTPMGIDNCKASNCRGPLRLRIFRSSTWLFHYASFFLAECIASSNLHEFVPFFDYRKTTY